MMFTQMAVNVTESSQIGEVRRHASRIAAEAGLSQADCNNTAIVAMELATNLSRYATGGEVLLRTFGKNGGSGVEILALDRGPGIADVAKCLADGYSTGGTPGAGLGAIRRLSTEFDIFSMQPGGTVVLSRIQANKGRDVVPTGFSWGAINRPAPHEQQCGDTWRIAERPDELAVMVADGLGHGPLAALAADSAAAAFEQHSFQALTQLFTLVDQRTRGSRGAAVAVAQIQRSTGNLKYAGVGNIAASLKSQQGTSSKGLISHSGTVGVEMRKVQQFDYECPEQAVLIMHSDGLQNRWALETYPGLLQRHPSIIAAILYRDFLRGRDDVTVVVIKFSVPRRG
ncbi:MAG: ATP-binding SpoIIE family protein phosphatase [Planctomycetales bacterium]